MGWRENMGVKNFKPQEQKPQKEQKPPEQPPFATIAPFATVNPKTKTDSAPPQNLSRIQPEDIAEYTSLWYQACELEDYTSSDAPYPERITRIPELNELVERMRVLENKIKTAQLSDRYEPKPDKQLTCYACKVGSFWRKNEPNSKWICSRCHPPAPGLDVIFRDE